MSFAFPLPWWLTIIVAAAIIAVAYVSYRRPLMPLSPGRRVALGTLRALTLAALVVVLCRPVVSRPPAQSAAAIVPIVIDASRSMRIADVNGEARITRAQRLVDSQLLPALREKGLAAEILAAGEGIAPADTSVIDAAAPRSDLTSALAAVRERYRGREVPAIVLISDGGDTGGTSADQGESIDVPIFTVGVGSPEGVPDREVLSVTAGDPRIDQTSVDVRVSAVARGFGRGPFSIRLLANGRLVESREVTPAADGAPVDVTFAAVPDQQTATVFTAEVGPTGVVGPTFRSGASTPDVGPTEGVGPTFRSGEIGETVLDNNTRSTLVSPPARRRRVLALFGGPGYDHSFFARALTRDPAIDVDMVVRKGRNDAGQDTFLVQAASERSSALAMGFPPTRAMLFTYDAIVLANLEADALTRAQLEMLSDFVGTRGGGLLVLGGRMFANRGLAGTPIEAVLPIEIGDRRAALTSAAAQAIDRATPVHTVVLTPEGIAHPVMRFAEPTNLAEQWAKLPALAAVATLGGPRPGASVLAMTVVPNGGVQPLVAVQPFGRGRSMVFGGEASWRWRMLLPAENRSYELFWRQAVRWLATPSPDRLTLITSSAIEPGEATTIAVEARTEEFAPAAGMTVEAAVTQPGGDNVNVPLRPDAVSAGRFVGTFRSDTPGVHRLRVDASNERGRLMGDRWIVVGGNDREMADPRLNDGYLSRLAASSGGQYARADQIETLLAALPSSAAGAPAPELHDVWHRGWTMALVLMLLGAEWTMRRHWGLR